MNNIVNVTEAVKHFGNVKAVDGASFEVASGEFIAIQGASGSGKSTLLGLLAGFEKLDQGKIVIDGADIRSMDEDQLALFRRRKIGFVFQAFNLIPTLNVVENIALPLFPEHHDRRGMLDMARRTAHSLGLSERLTHYPAQLSGGEQQRVAIARALINNPKVILADEPTGNLDSKSGERIVQCLSELNKEKGLTVLMVTHDDRIAARTARILNVVDGRIV
ncbi:MAG: ABC transporter ATP-binding protein [Chloroflexi bacterium]|nr:ABC transporter ATP-binding protein [Chloroflexota bacterium]